MPITNRQGIGLTVIGSSGSQSILSTTQMFMKADITSGNLNLFTVSKPTGISIPHQTNWDSSLVSFDYNGSVLENGVQTNQINFAWKDYSTNQNDSYYSSHFGKVPVDYYIDMDWSITDLDIEDEFAVVGNGNFTSINKLYISTPITRELMGVQKISTAIYPVKQLPPTVYYPVTYTTTSLTVETYNLKVEASIYGGMCQVTSGGNLTINYNDINGSQSTIVAVSTPSPGWSTTLSVTSSSTPTKGAFTGVGDPCLDILSLSLPFTQTSTVQDPIPDGAVQVGNFYYFPQYAYDKYPLISRSVTKYSYTATLNLTSCPCSGTPSLWEIIYDYDGVKFVGSYTNPTNGVGIGVQTTDNPNTIKPKLFIDGTEYPFSSCASVTSLTTSTVTVHDATYYKGTDQPVPINEVLNYSVWDYSSPPPGSFSLGNGYSPPKYGSARNQNFLLTGVHWLLDQNPGSTNDQYIPSAKNGEFYDYSDIFFEITYSDTLPAGHQYNSSFDVLTDVTATTKTKLYKFGGYITIDEFYNDAQLTSGEYVSNDTDETWKLLVGPDRMIIAAVLSSYIKDSSPNKVNFNGVYGQLPPTSFTKFSGYDSTPNLPEPYYSQYGIIEQKNVLIDDIKVFKVINFPNCGKVDLYKRKTGSIDFITSNTIYSANHNLSTGEQIKITQVLSNSSRTNLNGLFYVKVISSSSFNIYYDKELANQVTPTYVRDVTGIRWAVVQGQPWVYQNSLYSPCGKNGYSTLPMQLNSVYEPPQLPSTDPMENSVDYSMYIDHYTTTDRHPNYWPTTENYPQGYFNGARSWNNFYPFVRFNDTAETAFSIINGNKFGSSVKIKKMGADYILMVTEPGAGESFPINNGYSIDTDNQIVVPSYLPYGRIHFYRLHGSNVYYLTSISKGGNPWDRFEKDNFNAKKSKYSYTNAQLYPELAKQYNTTTDNYWNGARYVSWGKNVIFNSSYNIEYPDIDGNPYEFAFVDSFGKTADMHMYNNYAYVAATSNVKNANFNTNSRMNSVDATWNYFNIEVPSYSMGILSSAGVVSTGVQSPYITQSYANQYKEYQTFGQSVAFNASDKVLTLGSPTDVKLLIGWPSAVKTSEYIYYYEPSGADYTLRQTMSMDGVNGFGEHIVTSKDIFTTSARSYIDDSGNVTTNPLPYLQTYNYIRNDDEFVYHSRISPTVDLSSPKYSGINPTQYEITKNTSYDGTSSNSATYIIDLANKFDLYNGMLFLRDFNELSVFQFTDQNGFRNRSHNFVTGSGQLLNTDQSMIRVSKSSAPSTYDKRSDIDSGEYSESIQVLDFSTAYQSFYKGFLSSINTQNLQYLPLFIQTTKPYSSGINLYTKGNSGYASGIQLYLEPTRGSSGNIQLYIQPPYPYSGSINTYIGGRSSMTNNNQMYMNGEYTTGLGMFILYDPTTRGYLSLHTTNPIVVGYEGDTDQYGNPVTNTIYSDTIGMYIESHYQGSPNSSGSMPLRLQVDPSIDYASSTNLVMKTTEKTGSGLLSLFIDTPVVANMNLVVYNTINTSSLNLYSSGAYTSAGSVNMAVSGYDRPSGNLTSFIRGNYI